jgi:hypothetical protein
MTFHATLMNSNSFQFNRIQSQLGLDSIQLNSNSIGFGFNSIEFKNIVRNSNLLHLKFQFDLI